MPWTETKRTAALLIVGTLFAFGVVRMVYSGEERTRDVIHQLEQSMIARDARAVDERQRALLLLEVVKQAQALGASRDYTDRRIEELVQTQSGLRSPPATRASATQPTPGQ